MGKWTKDSALNAIVAIFNNAEEVEGPDGMSACVELSLWHEASEAIDFLIDGYDAETLATTEDDN